MDKDTFYNMVTVASLIGTLLVIGVVGVLMLSPAPQPREIELTLLAQSLIPTREPSATPTETLTPTTTSTPTETLTPTITNTPTETPTQTATIAPSATITDTPAPSLTPSHTPTPANTDTPTPTATSDVPTETFTPTLSPFLFDLRENVVFIRNFANTAQCAWQGVGGQVVGIDGQPFSRNLQVRVFNNTFERVVPVGSNSLYGQIGTNGVNSGYEVQISNAINNQLYFVQLETVNGVAVSPTYQLQFPSTCEGNVAIVNFLQQRPF